MESDQGSHFAAGILLGVPGSYLIDDDIKGIK